MASSALPVSRLIKVSVSLTPQGAQAQNLSTLLVLGTSDVIDSVERVRSYSSLDAVGVDFGSVAPEYAAAALWFAQSPQPSALQIGRWAQAATKGGLRCAVLSGAAQGLASWNAITAGSFAVALDGGAVTNVTGLNFSTALSLSGVAAIIDTALVGGSCVWNAAFQRFEFKSDASGASSSVSFLTAAGTGTDVSGLLGGLSTSSGAYVFPGLAAETPAALVAALDNQFGQGWYACTFPSTLTDDEHLAVAAYIEGANTRHVYAVTTAQGGVLVAATTTDIASKLKALSYAKTFVQYSSTSAYAAVSALARILTTDYAGNNTTITLMYKQEPGVVAETLLGTQADAIRAKNCNVFVAYNNATAILQYGTMASGAYADEVLGADWLAATLQTALYNLVYTSPTKIPQTDQGMHLLATVAEGVCSQAVTNGLLGPGVWNSAGFGNLAQGDFLPKGFYVYAPKVADQSVSARAARKSVSFQVAAKLAGAVHEVVVGVSVNQ